VYFEAEGAGGYPSHVEMMPDFSGIEVAIAIQQECPQCKIMLFSGHAHTLDLMSIARAKGYDFNLLVSGFRNRGQRKYGPAKCWVHDG
jgi:CheY-like chemotaxis protein